MSTNCKNAAFVAELSNVNAAVRQLSAKDRDKAVEILGKFGATRTPELKREDYQSVQDLVNAELARFASKKRRSHYRPHLPAAPAGVGAPPDGKQYVERSTVASSLITVYKTKGPRRELRCTIWQ